MAEHAEPEASRESTDSVVEQIPPDTKEPSPSEISAPMLDVHAPHEAIHTWKNFLIHIAAIVVGLLIAVGLEQTVEFFHHRDQREQLEAALKRDGEANRGYIKGDIVIAQGIRDWALDQTLIGRAKVTSSGEIDVSTLTPAQRLTAAECLRAIAEHARTVLLQFLIYDAGNEYILSIPLDQLDTPEAERRYTQIINAKIRAYPAVNLTFGGVGNY